MNKKMSYNVNAIVGKYIMPVTFHKIHDEDDGKCRRVMIFNHDIFYKSRSIWYSFLMRCGALETLRGFNPLNRVTRRLNWRKRKTMNETFLMFYIINPRVSKKDLNPRLKKFYKRFKPTSKYYMAFARISEFFY